MNLVYFNSRDQLLRIAMQNIVYFEADGNLTHIILTNKMKSTVSMNLGKMEDFLSTQYGKKATSIFLRLGKRFIINMDYIYMIDVSKQRLVLSDYKNFAYQLPVSKDALKKVRELVIETKR